MKLMKKYFSVVAVAVLALSFAHCGSSDATDTDDGTDAATGTGDDAQATSAVSATAGSSVGSAIGGATGSESVASLVRAAVIQKRTVTEETVSFEETVDCSGGGSVTFTFDGTFSMDDTTFDATMDIDATNTLDECTEEVTVETADGQLCTFTTIADGSMVMNMSGDFSYTPSTESTEGTTDVDLSATVTTASACSGMSITLDGTTHTIGLDLSMDFSGSVGDSGPEGDPTLTGTICVDDEEIDVSTVSDLSDFDAADLACE